MKEKITPLELKKLNRNRIFRMIYENKGVKRQDLSDELSLSLPTVNQNIKELMEEGLIEFSGEYTSTGGRKPQVITPVADYRLTIALNIRKTYVRIVLVDFNGEVLDSKREELVFADDEKYSQKLGCLVDEFIRTKGIPLDRILGIGLTIPGIFDKESERILIAPTLGIRDYAIENLTRYIGYPSIVINDAKASAFTYIRKSEHLSYGAYLLVDRGVGGCIITDGKLVRGVNNRAGELGHMIIVPNGRKCACGKSGCLESYVSTARITEEYHTSMEEFFGQDHWEKERAEYLHNLAIGLNNLYTILDCPIIVGGSLAINLENVLEQLKKELQEVNPQLCDSLELRLDGNSKKEALTGAALMLLEDYVKSV
ncbi:MAG: ROK family protein [Lachnospiraceae bacterium]